MPCSRNFFKMVAILFMLIDHIGLFLLDNNMLFRIIGRLAFPMFVYLLADGYHRTKDVKFYLLRLAALFAISYIPYSLAMSGGLFYPVQNIYASLFLYEILFCGLEKSPRPTWEKFAAGAAALLIAVVLNLQYSWYGVAVAIVMFYLHNVSVQESCAALLFLGWLYGYTLGFPLQAVGGLSVFFVPCQGNFIESQKPSKALQWVNYLFYPVHLLFFAILRM